MGSAVTSIDNQIYIELEIEGAKIPATPNLIGTISINESVMQMTPVMQLSLLDASGSLVRDLALTEGTKLKILLGKSKQSAIPREFRLFGVKQKATREGSGIVANFVLNAPKYVTESCTEAYEGNSSDVMTAIASKCNLKSDVSKTNDYMTWLNFGQTRAAFAEDTAIHGYNDESSCMFRALTSRHVLRYKDAFDELAKTQPKRVFALNANNNDNSVIQIRDIRDVSVSGVMNNWLNYGWKYIEHSRTGKEILHEQYKVKTAQKYLSINGDVKSNINGQTRVEYSSKLDCGNAHKNYHKAYYINLRGRALLGERLHILVEDPSDVQLLDIVEFRHRETDGHTGKAQGKYIVTAKVTYVANGLLYLEKIELCRAGLREAGNTNLIG